MKKLLMTMIAGSLVFGACKKDEDPTPTPDPVDSTKPTATISSPVSGAKLNAGDNLVITAKVMDETELKSYNLKLMNESTVVKDTTITVTGTEAAVNMTMNTTGYNGAYTVSLIATDAADNVSDAVSSTVTVDAGDTEAPKVNSIAVSIPLNGKLNSGFDNMIKVDATDNEELVSIKVEIYHTKASKVVGTGNATITDVKAFSGDVKVSVPNISGIFNDVAEIRVTATDKNGNVTNKTKAAVLEY